ncbi:hypothetical protein [Abyssisolibacter fermentans]|uniref:hypothetical protein n=1 Tax=Abyssisolibacter fermentans TaxID=1766203 RepID=UPI0008307723|nr:hypothetical protein [Abyssisolibacter fermentans]
MKLNELIKNFSIKDEKDLFNFFKENKFEWGMVIDGKKENNIGPKTYSKHWTLIDPEKIIEDKIAICWDYANLEKSIFDKLGLRSNIYYLVFDDDIENNPSHCFTILERENNVVLFEYSFRQNANIYVEKHIEDIFKMIINWCYNNFDYLRDKDVTVYKFTDIFQKDIDAKELLNLAKNQEIVFVKSFNDRNNLNTY